MSLTASPLTPSLGFLPCPTQAATKGKRNAERRVVNTRACGAGRALRSALASRRPTAALARRLSPSGSASGHASGEQSGAFSPLRPLQPGSGDLALFHGRYPRRTDRPTASTSRTGPIAGGMMPDAARERVTSPPAGTALAPSQGVSSRRTSLRKASWESFRSPRGANSRNSAGPSHLSDPTQYFFWCLFDSGARKLWHCCHDSRRSR